MTFQAQPRAYHIVLFGPDGKRVATDLKVRLFLDLRPGLGLRRAGYELDSLLAGMASEDQPGQPAPDISRYYLHVSDVDGTDEFHWKPR